MKKVKKKTSKLHKLNEIILKTNAINTQEIISKLFKYTLLLSIHLLYLHDEIPYNGLLW